MTADKKTDHAPKPPASGQDSSTRKPWVPKSPVEVILDQIRKQEKRVAELEQQLSAEKILLNKLAQAKKVLDA
jgi:hypothetical protein